MLCSAMCVRCVAVCVVCCCCVCRVSVRVCVAILFFFFFAAFCCISTVLRAFSLPFRPLAEAVATAAATQPIWPSGSLDRAPSLQRSRVHHLLLEVMISLVVPVNSQRAHTQPCSHRTALLRQAQTTTGTAATKRDGMQGYNLLRQGCTISSVADGRRCDRSRTPMFTSHCLAATGQ